MTERVRRAWVLNLDAELELAEPAYSPRPRVLAQLEEHGKGSQKLLGPDDVLLEGSPPFPPEVRGMTGRAWCPTPRALSRMANAGVIPEPHPDRNVLHDVNHRKFAALLGGGLPEQRYVEDRANLENLLPGSTRDWLLKRPLSFAGRGQVRILGGKIDEKQWSWIDASLRRSGLIVEPLVRPLLEVSLHGFIRRSGEYELGRICVQEVSDRGVFRDVRLATPGELSSPEEAALSGAGKRVAEALHRANYFGPFGIDGYRYELDRKIAFCELSEVNARYTMGFAVGFPRHPSELVP
jgi:hypothetical protein